MSGADFLYRWLLLFAAFLPLERHYSLVSLGKKESEEPRRHFSFWVLAFTAEVIGIYFLSHLSKESDSWRKDFTALYYVSHLDDIATGLGVWLQEFPRLQKLFTFLALNLEGYAPWLLLTSWIAGKRSWKVRTLVISLFLGMHLGILLTMNIGIFTYLCLTMWMIFIPREAWERLNFPSLLRGAFEKLGKCCRDLLALLPVPPPPPKGLRRAMDICGLLILTLSVLWNASGIKSLKFDPGPLRAIGKGLGLSNKWDMFSPGPRMRNTWTVARGFLDDGSVIDLLSGSREVRDDLFQSYLSATSSGLMRTYYSRLSMNAAYAPFFAAYLCRRWNQQKIRFVPASTLRDIEVEGFFQINHLDGERGPPNRSYARRYHCE
jgi:hypothetical protein